MNIKLFPQDKLAHYFYGSHAAWLGAALAMLIALALWLAGAAGRPTAVRLALAGMIGAAAAAFAIGLWKEHRDAIANRHAAELGEPPPNDVSAGDVRASAVGSLPVVLVLLALALASVAAGLAGA